MYITAIIKTVKGTAPNIPKRCEAENHIPVRLAIGRVNSQEDDSAGSLPENRKETRTMKKFNLRAIMTRAWKIFRKASDLAFGECLHRAWLSAKALEVNEARIKQAKAAAGIEEETNTWAGWKQLGYEVIHGSKALFGCDLIWGSKGDGATYKARFFGASQVQAIA